MQLEREASPTPECGSALAPSTPSAKPAQDRPRQQNQEALAALGIVLTELPREPAPRAGRAELRRGARRRRLARRRRRRGLRRRRRPVADCRLRGHGLGQGGVDDVRGAPLRRLPAKELRGLPEKGRQEGSRAARDERQERRQHYRRSRAARRERHEGHTAHTCALALDATMATELSMLHIKNKQLNN